PIKRLEAVLPQQAKSLFVSGCSTTGTQEASAFTRIGPSLCGALAAFCALVGADELHAAVQRSVFLGNIRYERNILPVASGGEALRGNAAGDQILADRVGSPIREIEVVAVRPFVVGVALNFDLEARVLYEDVGDRVEDRITLWFDGVFAEREMDLLGDLDLAVGDEDEGIF